MAVTRKLAKALGLILGACTALLLVVAVGGYYLLGSMCANEVLAESPSPDGTFKAIVYERDCGATSDFSTQISVLRSWRSLSNSSGNAFVSDSNHGAAPSGPGGGPEVRLEWASPTDLIVSRHRLARVFLAEPQVGRVNIRYKQFE